jgi:hypothetical protein
MTLDRPSDGADGPGEARREQGLQHRDDVPAARAELAEPRSRAEYCESLRGADGRSVRTGDNQHETADPRTDRSGWDEIEAENRPSLDQLRITAERITHILDGDATGGGHRHGTGRAGKTEFPADWDDEKITDALLDVARRPDHQPGHQRWNDRWVARGMRDDVEIVVVIAGDGRIWTGWPNPGGLGVVKNPEET